MAPSTPILRPAPTSAEERLWAAVTQVTREWVRLAKEEARTLGLSLPQLMLLGTLRDVGTVPVARWADMIGSSPSAATGLLDRLESEGYVARAHGGQDRRQVLVSLTPKGRRLGERLKGEFRDRWRVLSEGLSTDQLDRASEVLERIVSRMEPSADCASAAAPRRHTEGR